jgi:parallel beta-helix repeat protein
VDKNAGGAADGDNWDDAFTSLSTAIQGSYHNDDLWVTAAEYIEAVTVDKYLRISGGFSGDEDELEERYLDPDTTIINAEGTDTHAAAFTADATLDSFIIRGGDAVNGGGVYIENASPALVNCVIALNDSSSNGGGVYCTGSSPRLLNCSIVHNEAEGLYAASGSNPTLTNCIVWENDGQNQVASDIYSSGCNSPSASCSSLPFGLNLLAIGV